jgi:hypothetical protein
VCFVQFVWVFNQVHRDKKVVGVHYSVFVRASAKCACADHTHAVAQPQ